MRVAKLAKETGAGKGEGARKMKVQGRGTRNALSAPMGESGRRCTCEEGEEAKMITAMMKVSRQLPIELVLQLALMLAPKSCTTRLDAIAGLLSSANRLGTACMFHR